LHSLSKSVLITEINDTNNSIIVPSVDKCIEYLRNKGLVANRITFIKYINIGKPYKGYLCKYV